MFSNNRITPLPAYFHVFDNTAKRCFYKIPKNPHAKHFVRVYWDYNRLKMPAGQLQRQQFCFLHRGNCLQTVQPKSRRPYKHNLRLLFHLSKPCSMFFYQIGKKNINFIFNIELDICVSIYAYILTKIYKKSCTNVRNSAKTR